MRTVRNTLQIIDSLAPVLEHEKALEQLLEEAVATPSVNASNLRMFLAQRGVRPERVESFVQLYLAKK